MAPKKKNPNILAKHPDYLKVWPKYRQIRDVLAGEIAVKDRCRTDNRKYLPLPKVEADEIQNAERYESYLARAVFYNATSRTLSGVVGQVFSKQPVSEFPESVDYLRDDPAGSGITLEQQAKSVLADLLSLGRAGLWTDFPTTKGGATQEEVKARLVRPVVLNYKPEDIRNWRVERRGSRLMLTLVVLAEEYVLADDGFEQLKATQYRELRLDENGEYYVRIWREQPRGILPMEEFVYPEDAQGNRFTEIPFVFVGIENNDSSVDNPPLFDMAVLNIAHFRNSADYEEACFMVGQPTPWFSGLTDPWVKDTMKGKIFLGSRGGIPLPAGGNAGLLQVASNTLVKEAMDQKEDQMIALGAKLIQGSSVAKTATEVNTDKVSEVSTLASAARNTSAAYLKAFEFCSKFSGTKDEIKFVLSTDFDMSRMTSQELLAIFTVWQGKGLATEEFRDILRRAGYATLSLQDAISKGVSEKPEDPKATVADTTKTDNRATPKAE